MEREEVLSNLCVNDRRNPDHKELYFVDYEYDMEEDIPEPRGGENGECYCDNCFYGRDALALEILKLMDEKE